MNCKVCKKYVYLIRIRQRVGKHIILGEIKENIHLCGFCGEIGCSIDLVCSSGKGVNKTFKPSSDCKYFKAFSLKSSAKLSKNSPCTNGPIECTIFKRVFWSYNMLMHYKITHKNVECLVIILSDEKRMLANFSC